MRHADTFYVITQANATEQIFEPTFKEKAKQITLQEVYCNNSTAGITLNVYLDNQRIASYDCAIFAAGNVRAPLEGVIPPQQQLAYSITDLASAAHINIAVTFIYDVPA